MTNPIPDPPTRPDQTPVPPQAVPFARSWDV
jgi:hypothetical protein